MDRNVAELLMKSLLALGKPLNDATVAADQIIDEDERKNFLKILGRFMGNIYTELMIPIIRQYPDLDPDKSAPLPPERDPKRAE